MLFADYGERQATFESFLTAVRPTSRCSTRCRPPRTASPTASSPTRPPSGAGCTLISTSYTLRARSLQHVDIFDGSCAKHVAERLSLDPAEPLPRMLAACTIAALRTARERWLDDEHLDYHAEIDKSLRSAREPPKGDDTSAPSAARRASSS